MSEEPKEPGRAERLQQAFDAVAGGIDLRLEPAQSDPRCIGIAFMAFASIPYETDPASTPDPDEDGEIERLIQGQESLTSQQYRDGSWQSYLFDPHIVVAKEGLIETDQEVIDEWLESQRFLDFRQEYPWREPREVQITGLAITHLGPQLAAATYRVTETLADGRMIAGNAATLFARLEKLGWRGVVITKGGREEV
jgi:hypothetical protein